jgi:hypothetical protein
MPLILRTTKGSPLTWQEGDANFIYLNSKATPGGVDSQIQYNDNGALGAVPTLTYNNSLLQATGSFKGNLDGTAATASYVNLVAGPGISINGLAITASVRTVNGVGAINGNISTPLVQTVTGTSASFVSSGSGAVTGSLADGLTWIISNDPTSSRNGDVYIYNSGSVGHWYPVAPPFTGIGDARYLKLDGGNSPMTGDVNFGTRNITNAGTITATTFSGSLLGTASYASQALSSSFASTASYAVSSSYAVSASWAPAISTFPYTGSALITGSLGITGSLLNGTGVVAAGLNSHAEGNTTTANGDYSHAEGNGSTADGPYSHAEGDNVYAGGGFSHAEGWATQANGAYSHAEGDHTHANGNFSHAEGRSSTASGVGSHAEGQANTASGYASHAEGGNNTASGIAAHAEGGNTVASGNYSHAGGIGTVAAGEAQTVVGKYNSPDASSLFIVGNGSGVGMENNALTVQQNSVTVGPDLNTLGVINAVGGILLSLQNCADDAQAAGLGIPVGGLYRNGNVVSIRLN